jgi:hypothetical protein
MRKQIFAVLLALIMTLCGCSNTAIPPTALNTESVSEIAETESESGSFPSESELPEPTASAEVTQAMPEETAAPPQANTQSKETAAPSAEIKETNAPENKSANSEPPVSTEKPQETQKPTEAPKPLATEEAKPKSAYDYEFNIDAIKSDCIGIGQGMGLHLDSSLTPSNATWWNPVTASKSNQGEALKRNLESYIKLHTVENLGSYGLDEITDFNIYCEAKGNGAYAIYFLFA